MSITKNITHTLLYSPSLNIAHSHTAHLHIAQLLYSRIGVNNVMPLVSEKISFRLFTSFKIPKTYGNILWNGIHEKIEGGYAAFFGQRNNAVGKKKGLFILVNIWR